MGLNPRYNQLQKKKARRLVVDACVARSAGTSDRGESSSCRNHLDAILDMCHSVVMNRAILDEWKSHEGGYARTWRSTMAGRKKPIEPVERHNVSLDLSGWEDPIRKEIEKDICLLEAALSADKIIITRDMRLRDLLLQRPDGAELAARIRWINPDTDPPEVLDSL